MAPEVSIRVWNRRSDRSAIERWPRAELPKHWAQIRTEGGQWQSWAIDQAGELVGRLTLRDIRQDQGTLGIYLRPDKYGQGIGTAALIAFREVSPVRFIVADVANDNERARRCYEKAGFLYLQSLGGFSVMGLYLAPYRTFSNGATSSAAN